MEKLDGQLISVCLNERILSVCQERPQNISSGRVKQLLLDINSCSQRLAAVGEDLSQQDSVLSDIRNVCMIASSLEKHVHPLSCTVNFPASGSWHGSCGSCVARCVSVKVKNNTKAQLSHRWIVVVRLNAPECSTVCHSCPLNSLMPGESQDIAVRIENSFTRVNLQCSVMYDLQDVKAKTRYAFRNNSHQNLCVGWEIYNIQLTALDLLLPAEESRFPCENTLNETIDKVHRCLQSCSVSSMVNASRVKQMSCSVIVNKNELSSCPAEGLGKSSYISILKDDVITCNRFCIYLYI